MNVAMVIGNLTRDPVVKDVNGASVTEFGLAVNVGKKDNATPIYYSVSAWGKQGEQCAKHLHKGEKIAITGQLTQRTYKNSNSEDKFENALTVMAMEFLGGGRKQADTKDTDGELPF